LHSLKKCRAAAAAAAAAVRMGLLQQMLVCCWWQGLMGVTAQVGPAAALQDAAIAEICLGSTAVHAEAVVMSCGT
jgi:hypothetical protein